VIARTQLVHPDDLPRFARLGVVANFEPLWAQLDPLMVDLTIPRLGPERAARQDPIGSLARSGARISFGSDWPVSSLNPMEGLAVAVTRQTPAGHPPGAGFQASACRWTPPWPPTPAAAPGRRSRRTPPA
jgi:predicted amidohydrolase YtcJ